MTDAQSLTLSLHGRWHGRYGAAPCPVCQPERRRGQDALTIGTGHDGRLLLHCKKGCSFADVLAATGLSGGTWTAPDPAIAAKRRAEEQAQAEKRARQALGIWREAQPITDTIAERYLRGRGITCDLPETLRYHPECWHGAAARRLPAMVARIDGLPRFAIHRTYLRADGTGKADAAPNKAMLGQALGGAVRLADGPGGLVVAEGIETALSLACGLVRGWPTIWAALSAAGMAGLILPPESGRLTIATDGDAAGREAGHKLAERASALGWKVSLLPAPDGEDWNSVLCLKGGAA